jgi:putative transposase
MPTSIQFKAPFYPGGYYHIVFKSNDGVLLFATEENRSFFLQKFSLYFHSVSDCLAYCLLDNHVHFIIHLRTGPSLQNCISSIVEEARTVSMKRFLIDPNNVNIIEEVVERQVNSFMASYANAYNKTRSRKGSLFQSPFRRVAIKEESHLQQAIIYVHANAQKHGLIRDFKDYKYSSYWEIIKENPLNVLVEDVLKFFGGKELYIRTHQEQVDHYYNKGWPSSKLE